MSKKIAVALAFVATVGSATNATACNDGGCGHPATPTNPGLTVNTTNNTTNNNPTANANNHIGIKNENEISNHVAGGQGGSANNTNTVTTTGTVGHVAGGQATSATTNSGNSTNNNTTVYEARRIPVATAIGATANSAFADGCAMSNRGFGVGVQTIGVGISGNISGAKVWNDDSAKCHAAALETAIVQKSGTPADSATALLTASEKSPAVANAVQRLQGDEGTKLMKLFAVPAVVTQQQPTVTNYIINDKPTKTPEQLCKDAGKKWSPTLGCNN